MKCFFLKHSLEHLLRNTIYNIMKAILRGTKNRSYKINE